MSAGCNSAEELTARSQASELYRKIEALWARWKGEGGRRVGRTWLPEDPHSVCLSGEVTWRALTETAARARAVRNEACMVGER